MIPIIAATPLASSFIHGLFNSMRGTPPASTSRDFPLEMTQQTQNENATTQLGSIQGLIALQKSTGPLQPEMQMALAQQLLNKTVQLQDSSGNNVVGTVSNARLQNGQMNLIVNGKSYPLTSLQAVLHGVN